MIIKPLGRWAKELGVSTLTLKKWLIAECGLGFRTSPEKRVALVEKCYIDRILELKLARPMPMPQFRTRRGKEPVRARADRVGSPAADPPVAADTAV